MSKKVSSKIYDFCLYVVGLFVILNIIGIWVLWCTESVFGYVTGILLLLSLIAAGVLAFLNEKPSVRKQWIVWLICLCAHLLFFILAWCLETNDTGYAIPALFTVMVVAIGAAVVFFILRNKLTLKNKPYKLTETVANEGTSQETKSDTDLVQKTVRIQVDQEVDKTPVANFKPEEVKQEPKKEEEKPSDSTGVITL